MKLITFCIVLLISLSVASQSPSTEVLEAFEAKTSTYEGKVLPYRILYPQDFDKDKKYPLHLFLHGAGERGDDNIAQLIHGADLFLKNQTQFPAIVLIPQCPLDDYWADVKINREGSQNIFTFPQVPSPTWAMRAVQSLLDQTIAETYIDTDRIYLSGLSMGGMGTYELLSTRPDVFAAATPICGAGYPSNASTWAVKTPVWIFHGEDDQVVPIMYSQLLLETLVQQEVSPRVSFYPNVTHDSWTKAFAEPDFFSWIYKQSKAKLPSEQTDPDDCTPEWLKFSEATLLGKYQSQNEELSKREDPARIIFMGDSITEGWLDTEPDFWTAHPNYVNRGISGHTTSQMVLRFRQDVIELHPKKVVILAGTNDIAGNTGETSIETIFNNIITMAELAKVHNIEVAISSVLPVYDYPWKQGLKPADIIIALNTKLEEYAKTHGHAYIDYHKEMKDQDDGMRSPLTYDGVHCTKAGYDVMQDILQSQL